ncbi:MAG: hypothetical protein ACI8S6_001419 [Myxococcota bacterium]
MSGFSLDEVIEERPLNTQVMSSLDGITVAVALRRGPPQRWQAVLKRISMVTLSLGIAVTLLFSQRGTDPYDGLLFGVLALSLVGQLLSRVRRSGRVIELRRDVLVATRCVVPLHDIVSVRVTGTKAVRSPQLVYRLVIQARQQELSWVLPRASSAQREWLCGVIEVAAAEARARAGSAAEVPEPLRARHQPQDIRPR